MYADREILSYVDKESLRCVAADRGITLPEDCGKDEIITRILNEKARFQDTLRNVIHLELTQTKTQLSEQIKVAVEGGVEKGLKSSSHLRTTMSLIFAGIAMLLSIAGAFGIVDRTSLDEKIKTADDLNRQQEAVIGGYFDFIVEKLIGDTDRVLASLSTTLPKKEAIEFIYANQKLASRLLSLETAGKTKFPEERQVLEIVKFCEQCDHYYRGRINS